MKILLISDNVLPQLEDSEYLRRTYSDVEAVISCGDLPAPYIDFIDSVLNLPVFYVRGNHDTNYKPGYPGGDDLHRRIVTFHGIGFAGFEGSIRYSHDPAQYTQLEMWIIVLKMIPPLLFYRARHGKPIDVIITHSPPHGIHDQTDHAHQGFRSFRFLLKVIHPRYLLHGHVDTYDRRKPIQTQFAETEVLNINPVKVIDI